MNGTGAQAERQEHAESPAGGETARDSPNRVLGRDSWDVCGSLREAGTCCVNTGLLDFGWAPGLGELRSIFWQQLNILSGFKTLLIPYIVGGLF